jgi:hypothetical protein
VRRLADVARSLEREPADSRRAAEMLGLSRQSQRA